MKADVVVAGGGFAGIAAAVALAEQGRRVVVLERKRLLGGRAFSFEDPQTGETVDNGQHLLMGCYRHTLELLEKIGTRDKVRAQDGLQVEFLDERGKLHTLRCSPAGSIPSLIGALFKLSSISFGDKLRTVFLLPSLLRENGTAGLTVVAWLERCRQSHQMKRHFWEPLCLAALNESPSLASADLLKKVLLEAFGGQPGGNGLIFPVAGLSELTGDAAAAFLASRGGEILTQAAVKQIHIREGAATHVELIDGRTIEADAFISALPPHALEKILPPERLAPHSPFSELSKFKYSPIVSVHLWLSQELTDRPFLSLLNSPVHWVFNRQKIWGLPATKPQLFSLVVSGAHEWAELSKEEIQAAVERELARFFPKFHPNQIERATIIKEPHATITPSPELLQYRLGTVTKIENFFLAGDWIRTGLPATIESAVLSGKLAAAAVAKRHPERSKGSLCSQKI